MEGRMMGIGPPPPQPVEYTQEEFYCEKCQQSFEDETEYNVLVGLFICKTCKIKVEKDGTD
jgi:hypothetical protein